MKASYLQKKLWPKNAPNVSGANMIDFMTHVT